MRRRRRGGGGSTPAATVRVRLAAYELQRQLAAVAALRLVGGAAVLRRLEHCGECVEKADPRLTQQQAAALARARGVARVVKLGSARLWQSAIDGERTEGLRGGGMRRVEKGRRMQRRACLRRRLRVAYMPVTCRLHGQACFRRLRVGYTAVTCRLHGRACFRGLRVGYMAVTCRLHGRACFRRRSACETLASL